MQFLVDSNNKYGEVLRNNAFGKTIIRSFTEIDIQAIRTYFFKSAATINKGSPISPFFFFNELFVLSSVSPSFASILAVLSFASLIGKTNYLHKLAGNENQISFNASNVTHPTR